MAAVDLARLGAVAVGLFGLLVALRGTVRLRGEYQLSPLSIALGVAGLAASCALSVLLPPIVFHDVALWALLVGGGLVGLAAGANVGLRRGPSGVVARGGGWHTLPAAVALGGLQVSGVAGSGDGAILATAGLLASAALAAGAGSLLLLRWSVLRSRGVPAPGSLVAVAAHQDGPAGPAASALTARPSAERGVASAGRIASVRSTCAACGSPVAPGWRHCVTCGAALAWEGSGR